jgi:hypothetical protein
MRMCFCRGSPSGVLRVFGCGAPIYIHGLGFSPAHTERASFKGRTNTRSTNTTMGSHSGLADWMLVGCLDNLRSKKADKYLKGLPNREATPAELSRALALNQLQPEQAGLAKAKKTSPLSDPAKVGTLESSVTSTTAGKTLGTVTTPSHSLTHSHKPLAVPRGLTTASPSTSREHSKLSRWDGGVAIGNPGGGAQRGL